ncbi:phage holin [Bacillus cytotoxicus]|uniref:phage holin n=1 Tax=Bacillus cereus group TaxID=86661 RepID=UPI000B3613EE|nr:MULTISPECIES: phage holin [Bacillus cereus group]AWC29067.1 phage holin [Bacillus cytotoxicus]AWC39547.1 phage holin [Bacillus cytotoxicus]AWC47478.1 phage holin [Bacillus cytotoxicus]AWC53138.1 phage holin [Bacillus cytotoxicus]AWC57267.1 phage holin [Bacillus cytotoxicus]
MKNLDNASITRFVILIIAVINSVLNLVGYQTISNELTNNIVAVITGGYALYMAWKNNYLSNRGLQQKDVLEKHNLK